MAISDHARFDEPRLFATYGSTSGVAVLPYKLSILSLYSLRIVR